jgi:hypothetical protein
MMERTCGSISAADAPCAALASTSNSAVGAIPHTSDVIVNAVSPAMKSLRRPKASPSRPPTTSSRAYMMPYEATTSSRVAVEEWKLASIVGSATLTMKKSISGSAAPRSTVTRPAGASPGLSASGAARLGVAV